MHIALPNVERNIQDEAPCYLLLDEYILCGICGQTFSMFECFTDKAPNQHERLKVPFLL